MSILFLSFQFLIVWVSLEQTRRGLGSLLETTAINPQHLKTLAHSLACCYCCCYYCWACPLMSHPLFLALLLLLLSLLLLLPLLLLSLLLLLLGVIT